MRFILVAVALAGCTSIYDEDHETHLVLDAGEQACAGVTTERRDEVFTCTVNGQPGVCVEGILGTTTCAALSSPSGSCADDRLHAVPQWTRTGHVDVCR